MAQGAVTRSGAGRVARRPFGLPKHVRVRTPADHAAMRRAWRWRDALGQVLVRPTGHGHARFGFAVSRKVGNAVVRNRVKRRLREVFRHRRPTWPSVDVVVIARPPLADATPEVLDHWLDHAIAAWTDDSRRRTG